MSEEDGKAASVASSPFDDPQADLILRSSDLIDFRVMKCILALASPIFKVMFSLPQPKQDPDAEPSPPVVPVPEPSAVLDPLLRILYPTPPPELLDVDEIGGVLEAAHKYDMDGAMINARSALRACLEREKAQKKPTSEVAIAVYALACRFKLADEARLAARAFLAGPLDHPFVSQLEHLSAASYYHLLDYHRRVGDAVEALFTSISYSDDVLPNVSIKHHFCGGGTTEVYQSEDGTAEKVCCTDEWWYHARMSVLAELRKAPLSSSSFSSSIVSPHLKAISCVVCKDRAFEGWDKMKELSLIQINKKADKVELVLPWDR
ncbi:hypothetical protein DFH11DRAFT_1730529 [Phellopilus nigrolimitatus]|nr:hypothetical protein DFH11DRAFT_1730529 [Phellopilus nigrolimitatus]